MSVSDSFQAVREEGLRLWRMGYLAFPTYTDAKGPRLKKWTKKPMPQTESAFWGGWSYWPSDRATALSMTCNTPIVIIDVDNELPDPDKERGYNGFLLDDITGLPMLADKTMRFLLDQGIDLHKPPISRTPKGGYHIYYSARGLDLSPYSQARLITPLGEVLIDPRLPNRGAAMEAPTAGYKWIKPLVPIDELPPLPQQYIDWMRKKKLVEGVADADGLMDRLDLTDKEVNPLLEVLFAIFKSDPTKYSLGHDALHHRNEHLLPIANLCYWGAGLSSEATYDVLRACCGFWGYDEPDTPNQIRTRVINARTWTPSKLDFIGCIRKRLHIPMTFNDESEEYNG